MFTRSQEEALLELGKEAFLGDCRKVLQLLELSTTPPSRLPVGEVNKKLQALARTLEKHPGQVKAHLAGFDIEAMIQRCREPFSYPPKSTARMIIGGAVHDLLIDHIEAIRDAVVEGDSTSAFCACNREKDVFITATRGGIFDRTVSIFLDALDLKYGSRDLIKDYLDAYLHRT